MAFKPTKEQKSAIEARGNILVSAAAGSGKTAVLVERVIGKLCSETDGIPADKLLIVTFTNAAAAEMRTRIEKRLQEECLKNPDNIALTLQKHLLSSAKICTIDSFCIDLVRENFELADVSPDFKMSDAGSLETVNRRILSEIVERYLAENNPVFADLLDIVGTEYDESSFYDFVLGIYNYSRQLPFPEKWFKTIAKFYEKACFESESPWYNYAFDLAKKVLKDSLSAVKEGFNLLNTNQKAADAYTPAFFEAENILTHLLQKAEDDSWDTFYEALSSAYFPSLPVLRGVADIFEISAAKEIYKTVIPKNLERLKKIFYADKQFIDSQFSYLSKPMELLSQILIEFDNALFEEYKRLNTFTFHNTEHLSLKLLCKEENGNIVIRNDDLLSRFEEVMVDEYQDTNDLQDMLFYVLSNRESKLFVVGDIKQSIYGFRGANPANFMQKKNRYIPIEETDDTQPQKIILANNFRTKAHVCEFVNFFFAAFMNDETGDIIYNSEEALISAAKYPETNLPATELLLINAKNSDESANILEAREIARYITETMNQGAVIRQDDETLRPASYSDFTILLRSAKLKAPLIAEELKKAGIPVNFAAEDFAEGIEVATFLNLLTVIDNPQSDIELLSVLMSPIFGFSAEELSLIRAEKKQGTLYSAVIFAAQNNNKKAEKFLKKLEYFRLLSVTNTLQKLITLLLYETGYPDIVTAMNDGIRRRNNLLLLSDYAGSYITEGTSSLSSFVRYIKNQSQSGIKSASSGLSGDAVKIMSIHASKGLQFPICIVAGCASSFNDSESHEGAIYTTELSLGFKYFDENEKTRLTTVSREVILDSVREERLREELRLFYVAMTRTQDRLVFTGALSNLDKKIAELKTLLICSNGRINSNIFSRTKSYLEWLLLCVLLHPNGKEFRCGASIIPIETSSSIDISVCEPQKDEETVRENPIKTPVADLEKSQKIAENIAFSYPFADILEIEAKSSVSKLANSAESAKFAFSDKPAFMNKEGLSAAGRGTAMHKVMQFFDFSKCDCIEAELERLYEWRFISETEYKSLNTEKLKKFFESKVFERIRKSSLVKREMRFLTEIKAQKIAPHLDSRFDNENVIVQGAVDICFVEDDGVVILDFKTDFVEEIEELAETYGEQLNIYALACEKIFNKPVKQKLIYSFKFDRETEVE